jgi:bifunctional N-acetylglucosamine-1-phosphate-uridyltransferase/glucosamine-1-phosphate-acetyltransferase GlmU-like protein
MKAVLTEAEVDALSPRTIPFGAIVPAAGKGTRLGHDAPKILYPVHGRPILAWLLDLLLPVSARTVIVVSPAGRPPIEDELSRLGAPDTVALAVQAAPRGMADAVLAARGAMSIAHTLVVWGDQVGLSPVTIERVARLHAARAGATLTLATILRSSPYIHVERDPDGRIVRVHEARKAPIPVSVGENDCGLFAFQTRALFEILEAAAPGSGDGPEFDLLPLFPRFERGEGTVATMRITDETETLGINTPAEGERIAPILAARERRAW